MNKCFLTAVILLTVIIFAAGRSTACTSYPIAIIDDCPKYALVGDLVQFDGSSSYDPDGGSITAYDWDFPSDANNLYGETTAEPNCVFDSIGVYGVRLRVKDNENWWSTWTSCNVFVSSNDVQVWCVDTDANGIETGLTMEDAFTTIAAGISAASNGDIVAVAEGTYTENIDFNGKAIRLTSIDPDDSSTVANTIIDGSSGSNAVTIDSSEGVNSVITGFTVTGGSAGIYCYDTSPTITNCVIDGYSGSSENGLDVRNDSNPIITKCTISNNKTGLWLQYNSDPIVTECTFSGNTSRALYGWDSSSSATVTNCTFSNNYKGFGAEGSSTVTNSIFTGNTYYGFACSGSTNSSVISGCTFTGGYRCIYVIDSSTPTITNCVITDATQEGIWITSSGSPTIRNCTIVGNDYGIGGSCTEIKNCIIWDNGEDLDDCSATYSCIEDKESGTGTGNIRRYPSFADADNGDYHLKINSVCINAGDPASAYSNEPAPNGGRINMGAYGNTSEATTGMDEDNDGMSDVWELNYWPGEDPNDHDPEDDPDGDGISNIVEYQVGWVPTSDNSSLIDGYVENDTTGLIYPSINDAIMFASESETIILDPNTYYETIDFNNWKIHIRSIDPNDPNIVASTIIDANDITADVVVFNSGENANSVIEGITITGGYRGIYCDSSSPRIVNCTISSNSSRGLSAVSSSSPTITNCTFSGHDGSFGYGLGCASSSPIISRCTFTDNTRGIYLESSSAPSITNCLIVDNTKTGSNYGMYSSSSSPTVVNCTIVGNEGYGISGACAQIKNCVIWNNGDDLENCSASFSCIEDRDVGEGNIARTPHFVDPDNGDYHLKINSLCINAGDPNSAYSNELAPNGGRINMGAYGNTSEATTGMDEDNDGMSDVWELYYWPGEDPNDHDPGDDPDDDGVSNLVEYHIGWNPAVDDSDSIDGYVENTTTALKYPSVSMAISWASDGDVLVVDPNTFYETINYDGKKIHVQSTDPNDSNIVASTIINANDTSSGVNTVTFSAQEDAFSILDGITATGGYRGMFCNSSSSPTIMNCIVRDNANTGIAALGPSSSPTIYKCTISDTGNYGVGWEYGCSVTISNCIIKGSNLYGISGSSSSSNPSTIANCVVVDNNYGINVNSNTKIVNCILWDNNNDLSGSAIFSCIEDGDSGVGNFKADPDFVDPDNGDYHLDPNSVCVDAGAPWSDYSKEPAPNGGRVNLGAYGNTSDATTTTDEDGDGISDSWERYYWPEDDPSAHDPNDNSDSDDFTNWAEYLFRYDPNQYTDEPMLVPTDAVSLSASVIDPTKDEVLTIEYWLNKKANVTTSFKDTDPCYPDIIRAIEQSGTEGLNYVVWDGYDANGLVAIPGYMEIKIEAQSVYDVNDTYEWTTPPPEILSGSSITNRTVDGTDFDPYKGIPLKINFNLTGLGGRFYMEIDEYPGTTEDFMIIHRMMVARFYFAPTGYTFKWFGQRSDGTIYVGNFCVSLNISTRKIWRSRLHIMYKMPDFIESLTSSAHRIVPIFNEVSTITYGLKANSKVLIRINDPYGNYFRTVVNSEYKEAGTHTVTWDGQNDSGRYATTEGAYVVFLIAEDPDHPGVQSIRVGTIIATR